MMARSLLILNVLAIFCFSCEKAEEKNGELILGTYQGNYLRSYPHVAMAPSAVTLTFNETEFFGTSEYPKNPAICNGSYQLSGNQITFENACPWTADFDWSLVLDGTYQIQIIGKKMIISRAFNGIGESYDLQLK